MPFNVGLPEMLIILVIALIVFGPRKLPEIGASVGKAMREFKRASSELTDELNREVEVEKSQERRKAAEISAQAAAPYVPEQTQAYGYEPSTGPSAPQLGPPPDGQGHLVETPSSQPKES